MSNVGKEKDVFLIKAGLKAGKAGGYNWVQTSFYCSFSVFDKSYTRFQFARKKKSFNSLAKLVSN